MEQKIHFFEWTLIFYPIKTKISSTFEHILVLKFFAEEKLEKFGMLKKLFTSHFLKVSVFNSVRNFQNLNRKLCFRNNVTFAILFLNYFYMVEHNRKISMNCTFLRIVLFLFSCIHQIGKEQIIL